MLFLTDSLRWPKDNTNNKSFIVKAVSDTGRSLNWKTARLPALLYRYDDDLPSYGEATEEDKKIAGTIIWQNCRKHSVTISEKAYYSEKNEENVTITNYIIDELQWNQARSFIKESRLIDPENIRNSIAIAKAIFTGIADGSIVGYGRSDTLDFSKLQSHIFNIDDDDAVRARLALGQIDPSNPLSLETRGPLDIFLDNSTYDKWYKTGGSLTVRRELAFTQCLQLIKQYPKSLPKDIKKEYILDEYLKRFMLDTHHKKILWDSLPDVPFKQPGVR